MRRRALRAAARPCTTRRRTTCATTGSFGDKAATDAAFAKAAHVTKLDLVNNRLVAERDGAARRDRRLRPRRPTSYTLLHHQPEPARDPPADGRLRARHPRAQAARRCARRRRRLRLEDLPLRRGSARHLGAPRRSAGRSSGRPSARRPSCPTPMAATTSPTPSWRSTRTASSSRSKCDTMANIGAYLSTFAPCVPTYLYGTLLAGQYTTPAIYVQRARRSSPTPCRSTPIAAPGGPRRPSCSSG